MAGNLEIEQAHKLLSKINENYPVSLNALWVEPDDCFSAPGVRVHR